MQPEDAGEPMDRALLIGVSDYRFTKGPHAVPGKLPAVEKNLPVLREALVRAGVFRDRNIVPLPSPDFAEAARELQRVAGEARGLLLVYFAGHGAIPSGGDELYLQMRDAQVFAGEHTVFNAAVSFSDLMGTVLATSRADRIVVILDCCFAGNAARVWEHFEDKRRVVLLMSVQANHRIDAGDPDTPTPYTENLAELLGEEGGRTVSRLAARLRRRMAEQKRRTLRNEPWQPQLRADAEVTLGRRGLRFPLLDPDGPGPSGSDPSPDPPSPSPPPRRPRLPAWVVALWRRPRALAEKWRRARRREDSGPDGGGRPARRILLRLAVPALLALGMLGVGLYGPLGLAGGDDTRCAPPLELRVLTDADLEETFRTAADAYLTSDANTTGAGCRRTGITVYSAGSSDVVDALRRRTDAWQEPEGAEVNPQRDIGPQPDVWIPASRAEADRVLEEQDTDAVAELEPGESPLAHSPVVLAVPERLAPEGLDDITGRPLTEMIEALTGHAEGVTVRRPDPEFTDSGLLATVGLYGDPPSVAEGERMVGQQGPPSPTAGDLLCDLPEDDAVDDRTAALVPEFLLVSGVDCEDNTRTPRWALYPADVPGMDPVFVRVRWDDADGDDDGGDDGMARDAAVASFRDWLAGDGGSDVFARQGFRDPDDGELLASEHKPDGVKLAPSPLDESAGRNEMEQALSAYQAYGGPGRVLFLLDSSGSMADLWQGPSGGPGLLRQTLGGLGAEDEYGVWAVADTGDGPYETLLGFGRHWRKDAEEAVDERARVRDASADPHAALLAAFDEMEDRGDDGRPQMIVHITDGEHGEHLAGGRLREVLDRAEASEVPVTVAVLGSGGCDEGRPDQRIAEVSGGRCLDAGDDVGAALHDEIARIGTGDD
ncbi:substrate-binding domain-containing protein [Streptomyces althioticus]|uniref:vWA domain-containing protein n=1 Tax=Streptomyces althioticus TaxID=83380 RepID=UPI0037A3BB2A